MLIGQYLNLNALCKKLEKNIEKFQMSHPMENLPTVVFYAKQGNKGWIFYLEGLGPSIWISVLKGPQVQWEHCPAHTVYLVLHLSVIYRIIIVWDKGVRWDLEQFRNVTIRGVEFVFSLRPEYSSSCFHFSKIILWHQLLENPLPLVFPWSYFQQFCLYHQANPSHLNIITRISSKRVVWSIFQFYLLLNNDGISLYSCHFIRQRIIEVDVWQKHFLLWDRGILPSFL